MKGEADLPLSSEYILIRHISSVLNGYHHHCLYTNMGTVNISNLVMCCSLIAVVGMLASHSIIIPMMYYENGGGNTDFKESMEPIVKFVYAFLTLVMAALCFGLYLIVSPVISSNIGTILRLSISRPQNSTVKSDSRKELQSDVASHVEETKSSASTIPKVTLKNHEMIGSFKMLENSTAKPPMIEGCNKKSTIKRMNATDRNGSETTSGMSRGVKKQLAAILDEFWGLLFDYHGIPTEEAKHIRAALVLDPTSNQSSELRVPPITEETSSPLPATPMVNNNFPMFLSVPGYGNYVMLTGSPSFYGNYGFDLLQLPPLAGSYIANCGNQLAYTIVQSEFGPLYNGLEVDGNYHSGDANPNEDDLSQPDVPLTWGGLNVTNETGAPKKFLAYREVECLLIQSLRLCIRKLLKLEGSGWLFSQNGGWDEELIDHFAVTEILLDKEDRLEENWVENNSGGQSLSLSIVPYCGEGCILQARLVVSFGVWCVHRILDLLLVENRPELWGKYTYVLNRLQGILNPAFCKPRPSEFSCECFPLSEAALRNKENLGRAQYTSAVTILELIKDVEVSISGRKGRAGTGAANIAFPKGKENLASVFKRYKRRLSEASS